MATYSKRDLSLVPFMSFSFVESYIKSHKVSSGGKPITRGFMYFLESFVHDLQGELKHFISYDNIHPAKSYKQAM